MSIVNNLMIIQFFIFIVMSFFNLGSYLFYLIHIIYCFYQVHRSDW